MALVSWLVALASSVASLSAQPSSGPMSDALTKAVTQLRDTRGHWDVTTEFLKPDGAVARVASGTYSFEWVVEDRVLRGESAIPALEQRSAILFYVDQAKNRIEMASVGRDGHLWVMTGPADSETRTTPDTVMPDGSTMRLRFTRFNITRDRFESRMEVSSDRGTTWVPGNHQVFVRRAGSPAGRFHEAWDQSSFRPGGVSTCRPGDGGAWTGRGEPRWQV